MLRRRGRADAEVPRAVYLDAVDRLAGPLVEDGYRYARSGPHASLRRGRVTARISFTSSHANVAGELVALRISLQVRDAALGQWRAAQHHPRRADDVVATWHLGHLLDPPRWLEWDLADPATRDITLTDAAAALLVGRRFIDALVEDLEAPDPPALTGRVDAPALVEYLVRAGRADEAPAVIDTLLDRFGPDGRGRFLSRVDQLRRDGLPDRRLLGDPDELAYLVVQLDLPLRTGGTTP